MKYILFSIFFIAIAVSLNAQETYKEKNKIKRKDYEGGEQYEVTDYTNTLIQQKPKNIIFMIGDGMGSNHVFAAYAANGGKLFLQNFKTIGLVTTNSGDHFVTDSGAGGTALSCGQKTYNGAIGVDMDSIPIVNIREKLEKKGLATGVVSTSSVTHATPASYVAHQSSRGMYEAIAEDYLKSNIDVFIGGGYKNFTNRKDQRNLVSELEAKGYTVLRSIKKIATIKEGKLAGLTATEHNEPEAEGRKDMLPIASETAINILSNDKDGFFLMIEGSQIDWAGHQNNTSYIITEMLDFDKAIGKALEFAASNGETLIIVTADHETGGFAVENGSYETGEIKGDFTSNTHTGTFVPLFAFGPGADQFKGIMDNTDISKIILKLFDAE